MRTARSVWSASSLLAFLLLTGWSSFAATPDPIDLFQHLAGKTVLMPSDLARPTQPLPELGTNQADAAAKLESYLLTNGITAIHDGPRFLRLLPTRRVDELLTNAPLRAQQLKPSSDSNTIPAGMITILNVNIDDILAIYAELRNRTILRPAKLPQARLNLKTETALTLQEAVYAMDTVLALNGLSVVEDGIKFVQLVPASQKASIKPNAPPADLSAELVNPKEMPALGLDKPLTKVERDIQRLKKAVYDFLQIKAPPQRPAQRLLELYATLTDKTPSTNFGGMPIWFYINTPLTKAELLYAIETTFQLNDLTIVALDDETITLQKGGTKPGTPGGNPKPSSAAKAPPVK